MTKYWCGIYFSVFQCKYGGTNEGMVQGENVQLHLWYCGSQNAKKKTCVLALFVLLASNDIEVAVKVIVSVC